MGAKTLSKQDFIEKLSARASRYKMSFGQGQLDEWIKKDLTFAGERGPNIGHQPTYKYSCRHYRRTLQIIRLYVDDIKDRDEILVQLFIRGYGVKPHEVREALSSEFRKAREKLNSPLRSIFADREGEIPAGRKTQLKRQLGSLDERLGNAEYIIPDTILFSLLRVARNSESQERHKLANAFPAEAGATIGNVISIFAGMLSRDDENESEIERLIRASNNSDYELARTIFKQIRTVFQPSQIQAELNSVEEIAGVAIYESVIRREFAAFLLVQSLIMASHQRKPENS